MGCLGVHCKVFVWQGCLHDRHGVGIRFQRTLCTRRHGTQVFLLLCLHHGQSDTGRSATCMHRGTKQKLKQLSRHNLLLLFPLAAVVSRNAATQMEKISGTTMAEMQSRAQTRRTSIIFTKLRNMGRQAICCRGGCRARILRQRAISKCRYTGRQSWFERQVTCTLQNTIY